MPSRNAAAAIVNAGGSPDNLFLWSGKDNTHWHEYDAVLLTNRTGLGLVAGDVVSLSTANAISVVQGNSVASHRAFVVAMATIADTASGEFARSGAVSVKSNGAILVGEYVRKSATVRAIETTGVLLAAAAPVPNGTLGVALATASGGFCLVYWWPVTWVKANNLLIGSGTDQALENSTAETDITGSSISIGAATLMAAGGLVTAQIAGTITSAAASGTNNTLIFRLWYGATTLCTLTIKIAHIAQQALSGEPFVITADLSGHGATNQQRGWLRYHGRHIDTAGTGREQVDPQVIRGIAAEDSTAAKTFKVTAQLAGASVGVGTGWTVEHVRVVMPPT